MKKAKEENILGKRIQELRKLRKLTQGEMAKDLGVSLYTISNWEQGKAFPNVDMVPRLAEYFDVTTDYLFGYDHGGLSRELIHLIQRMPEERKRLAIQFFQNIDAQDQQVREMENEKK